MKFNLSNFNRAQQKLRNLETRLKSLDHKKLRIDTRSKSPHQIQREMERQIKRELGL